MTKTIDLTPRLRLAAKVLKTKGWTQGIERNGAGQMCLTGALRYCAPQTGDEYIIREVLRKRDHAESWNDRGTTTKLAVIGYLQTTEITDDDLLDTFGPQALELVAQIRTMFTLTKDQWARLAASWDASRAASRAASWDASRAASRAASWAASWDASWAASRAASWDASRAASWALHARDLIGKHSFTQEHYDILSHDWRVTIGKLHADDLDIFEPDDFEANK